MNEENTFELNSVFCRPNIPISVNDLAKQEDVDRWPHLRDVHIPSVDCSVELLIGNDNSYLLEPLAVRNRPSWDGH